LILLAVLAAIAAMALFSSMAGGGRRLGPPWRSR
jgi:hypothetical protein